MMSADNTSNLPLAGVRILDLTRALAGPFCTMILADLGADVFKVEPLPNGDFIRGWGPFDSGESTYFLSTNRNKKSIALDFRNPQSSALLRQWMGSVDIVVENFKPGVMKSMGLDFDAISTEYPKLIYASISGFGVKGPLGSMPGFDQVAQGYSGLMSVTGTAESGPVRVGVAIGDLTSGMWTAIALLAALRARETSGRGQKVELSLLGSLVSLLSVQGQRYLSLKEVPQRSGNEHPVIAPYGVFHAKDGEFSIAPATPEMWISLCAVLGVEELTADPRFVDNATRASHRMVLKDIIDAKLKARTRSDWMTRLQKVGIPCGPINSIADVLEDEQVRQSGLIDSIVHPQLGKLELLASPIQMAGLENGSTRMPPPRFGEHTEQILMALGHTDVEVKGLLNQGVVFQLALETMEAS